MAIVRRKVAQSQPQVASSARDALSALNQSGLLVAPVNIWAVAEYLGLEVQEEVMDDDMSGYLEYRSGRWVAGLNSLHHVNRRRFTLAHEIAHYVLHRSEAERFDDEVFARRLGSRDRREAEADSCAAQLLMPAPDFKQKVEGGVRTVAELASFFGVSTQALRFRAKNLGYSIS